MKSILILSSILVFAYALPAYDAFDGSDPQNYRNIEILMLESAVDQDGGYSFSFENDDGSKLFQEGQRQIVDDEHSVDRIRGSYSYNDVNGLPVSLTYTADENGYRPVGAHLPTPPPVPVEILRSLRFLATAKSFVDEQLYDYKPTKKVFRGHQYNNGKVPIRSRNNLRSNMFSDSPPSEVLFKSAENRQDATSETTTSTTSTTTPSTTTTSSKPSSVATSETSSVATSEPSSVATTEPSSVATTEPAQEVPDQTKKPAMQSTLDVLTESKKNINEALKESIEKTSKLTQSATKETAAAAVTAIREEATKLTDKVKLQVTKINEKIAATSAEVDVSKPIQASDSKELLELYIKIVPAAADEAAPKNVQVGRNARINP